MDRVKWSRLFRKRSVISEFSSKDSKFSSSYVTSGLLRSAACQTSNSLFVIGYFIAFSYSGFHASSILPGVVFVASIASLLSELCKYEFLTCRRNTSACSYICTYQNLGELPAFSFGWLQLLGRSSSVAIVARSLGSVFNQIIGIRLVHHHLMPEWLVAEDTIGISGQLIVGLFFLCGLKMTKSFSIAIKIVTLGAIVLFTTVVPSYFFTTHEAIENPARTPEDFLLSAALIGTMFKFDNKESRLLMKPSLISAYLGINYCITLLILVIMAIIFYYVPFNLPSFPTSGSPLLETLIAITKEPHWFVIVFACFLIFVLSITLIEATQENHQMIVKLASDGLIFKKLAAHANRAFMLQLFLSSSLELALSTFELACVVTFAQLMPDVSLGMVVTYRRYCSARVSLKRRRSRGSRVRGYELPSERLVDESDSDDTDIDAAVDEYKTHVYVSTVMDWNGPEASESTKPFNPADGLKIRMLLFVVSLTILAISLALRWISDMNAFSITISTVSLILYFTILSVLWSKPQKPRARIATFKVPCVPWISIGASLSACTFLFQLPESAWFVGSIWLIVGMFIYATYGYHNSRLNFNIPKVKTKDRNLGQETNSYMPRLRVLSQVAPDITFNSIPVYPQPYSEM